MKTLDFELERFKLGLDYNGVKIDFDQDSYKEKIENFMKELNELEKKYNFNLTHFAYTDSQGDEESQLLLEDSELKVVIGEIMEIELK